MNSIFLRRFIIGEFSLQRLVKSALLIYSLVGLWAYFFSDRLIFLPPAPSYTHTPDFLKLSTANAVEITALYLPHPQAQYTILYSHGNAEDLGEIRFRLEELRDLGFSVFAYDYPGYGSSGGRPSEKAAYQAINAAYDYLTQQLNILPNQIIIYGRSVGGGPSVDLASRQEVGGLVIESSFTTIFRVVTRIPIYPFDKFSNLTKIKAVGCPVLVMHGTADRVIPFSHGQKLYQSANEPKMAFWVEGAGHTNLLQVAGERYVQTLKEFVQLLSTPN